MRRRLVAPRARRPQAGFSLVELMVALTIALFVLGGLAALFASMRLNFRAQDQFAQLQDAERLVSTVLTETVRSAGFFPNPTSLTATSAMPQISGTYNAMVAGQSIVGGSNGNGDWMTVRYVTASGSGLMDCLGQTNTSGANVTSLNTYQLNLSTNTLRCSTNGGTNWSDIVSGVSGMSVLYGVDSNGSGQTDRYLAASDVTTLGLWSNVYSVRVTLNFVNAVSTATLPAWVMSVNLMAKS